MTLFRRLALITALLTWVLIVVGGVVRVSGSGLGCPDWPTCHGQLVPPLVLQAIIEYSHRFTASIVSIGIVATAVVAWARFRDRGWIIIPASLAVLLLVVQIALGAFTVELELTPVLVTAHLGTALAVFATTIVTASAARWATVPGRRFRVDGYARLALVTALATYALLLAGAFVIKGAASYACAGWPLCGNGFQLPTDAASSLNFTHRAVAALVTVLFLALVLKSRRARPGERALRGQLFGGLFLLALQIAIGAGVVLWRIPPFTAALHLAVASAFWGNLIALTFLICFPIAGKTAESTVAKVSLNGTNTRETLSATTRAYLNLTKPRIIVLLLITTLCGMVIAARGLPEPGLILATLVGGAFAAGGANAINCYIDRDIDVLMSRTRRRALPAGRVPPTKALIFGVILGILAFAVLATFANVLAAVLAEVGLLFYVLIYTGYLKRSTPQNIVIGGAAGSMPPMVGWAAVTGRVDLLALYLFAIIFFWTPPHFWALSLLTSQDYARANIPMLPLVMGEGETRRQILLYSILLVAVTMLLFSARTMGMIYLVAALALGAGLIFYAVRLVRSGGSRRARQLFMYSNIYLALIFAAMAIDRMATPALIIASR